MSTAVASVETTADSQPTAWPTVVAGASRLTIAAGASLGAGAIHAAAVSAHSEHRAAMATFTALSLAQIAWGAVALAWARRGVALVGVVLSVGAVAGWVVAKTAGIGFVDGLDEKEPIQTADAIAAGLAAIALVYAIAQVLHTRRAGRTTASPAARRVYVVSALVAGLAAIPGVIASPEHLHASDSSHGHDADAIDAASPPAVVPPKPYDPNLPIDLSGVEGVTPEQQARAENLIAVTLLRLPRFADPAVAETQGFRSIGDSVTGFEHFVNWKWIDDDKILDPDFPESLVYRVANGQRTLEAAMYMLPRGRSLDDVPTEIGGPLVQWHIHNNLCYTPDPEAPRVAGLTQPDGSCRPPLREGPRVPMVHVWIVPHECGPFAALEGIGAGQIRDGEARLCDHAHGASVASG